MSRVRVNYKSDLPPIEVTFKANGVDIDVPDHDFSVRFFVDSSSNSYYCGCHYDGDDPSYYNCAPSTDGHKLICYINNHDLLPGRLQCEYVDLVGDANYEDGVYKTVVPYILDIVLVDGAGEIPTSISAGLDEQVITRGISHIAKTSTGGGESGLVDTYTIYYTKGATSTFEVTNGEKGDQGDKGDKGDKGDQGNSGYSGAAGELEVVNNLTEGGETAALSAEMGKQLYDVQKTIKLGGATTIYSKDTADFWTQGKLYKPTATFAVGATAELGSEASSYYSIPVAVSKGDIISIKGSGVEGFCAAVMINADGTDPRCLVKHKGTGAAYQLVDTVVTEDGYVAFSRYGNGTFDVTITSTTGKIVDLEIDMSKAAKPVFPLHRLYPLFWTSANTYNDTNWRTSNRIAQMSDFIEIPDGATSVLVTCETSDGSVLPGLYPQIYFYNSSKSSTSSDHGITIGVDRAIPDNSKYYRLILRFAASDPIVNGNSLSSWYLQDKLIVRASMTDEQYDRTFMSSYYASQRKLRSYDWDDLKLTTACMAGYNTTSRKDFQLALITDDHGNHLWSDNFFRAANEHNTINAIVHCGDWQPSVYNQKASRLEFIEMFSKSNKPVYVVIGNHDHGENYVSMSASQKMLYNDIVMPMITNGWLVEGEYTENKCYYYHDFTTEKVRLIVVNDFDNDDLAENQYWEPVEYDPSAPAFLYDHTYTYDASNPTIVNCGEYNEYSFKLIKTVTTWHGSDPLSRHPSVPCMAVDWQSRIFSEEQAQWLADTLLSTPANFKVVIASHMPFSRNVTMQDRKFCQYNDFKDYGMNTWYYEHIATDFLAAVVDAFQRGVAFSHKVVMQGLADYLNTETDSQGNHYAYEVTANFANKNNGATFMCFIGGHCHGDIVWRHNTYTQWGVYPMATKPQYGSICDILDAAYPDYPNLAHWTAVAFGKTYVSGDATIDKRIGLARVGKDLTKDLTRRDIEFIDTSE